MRLTVETGTLADSLSTFLQDSFISPRLVKLGPHQTTLTVLLVIVCLDRSEAHCATLLLIAGSGSNDPSFTTGLKGYHMDLSNVEGKVGLS